MDLKSPFREEISLLCALGGGRPVPEVARLCNTSTNMEYIAAGTEREVQLAYASERLASRPFKFERGKVCTNGVPHL